MTVNFIKTLEINTNTHNHHLTSSKDAIKFATYVNAVSTNSET